MTFFEVLLDHGKYAFAGENRMDLTYAVKSSMEDSFPEQVVFL